MSREGGKGVSPYSTTRTTAQRVRSGVARLRGCAPGGSSPSPSADPAGEGVCRERLSEATDAMSVAPGHGEAMSGFVKARRPTEGKEEATEAIAASGRHEPPH